MAQLRMTRLCLDSGPLERKFISHETAINFPKKLMLWVCFVFILFPSLVLAEMNTVTLDACDSRDHAIAVDGSGKVHMSYIDDTDVPSGESANSTAYILKYASNASGRWETAIVDQNDKFERTKVVIGADERVHIFYRAPLLEVFKHAVLESGSWSISTIGYQGLNLSYAMTVDHNLNLHACYRQSGHLMYATDKSGAWVIERVGDDSWNLYSDQYEHSIAVDASNNVHICTYDLHGPDYYAINYLTRTAEGWQSTVLDTDISYHLGTEGSHEYYCTIALDASDKVHIVYFDAKHNSLKYATNHSGSWVIDVADQGASSDTDYRYISLTVDSSQIAHMAFRLGIGLRLYYKTNILGEWGYAYADGAGKGSAIAVDQDQHVHLAFHNWHEFKYATTREIPLSEYPEEGPSGGGGGGGGGGCFIASVF
jgi:hypothetical protein